MCESITLELGKPGNTTFFYEKGRTAIGSLVKENAGNRLNKMQIKVVNDIKKTTGSSAYDLVKIDVEGYEYELIKNLKPLRTKYLFLEVSSTKREKPYDHSELFSLVEKKFGAYNILHLSSLDKSKVIFDILFEFDAKQV